MTDIAIRVENLSKLFHIGMLQQRHDTLRDALTARLRSNPKSNPKSDELWALHDVSFEVKRGEVVGIIGRNGAGKLTLLKILSRITEPTSGRAEIHGRVGSLLEVGTGFHPELTGRENIYLNGAILGMRRTEIDRQFDEIVAFAEIERFLDTPVKRYSSGMYVRLAFAVAAHLESEIMLVDEVLAVGDAAFQTKCLGKMGDVAQGGKTVLFVSHNMAAIERLCHRAVLLQAGNIARQGATAETIRCYLDDGASSSLVWERVAPPTHDVYIRRIALENYEGQEISQVTTASDLVVVVDFTIVRFVRDLQLTIGLLGPVSEDIFDASPQDAGVEVPSHPGHYRARVSFPAGILLPKSYSLKIGFWLVQGGVLDVHVGPAFTALETASMSNSRPGGRVGLLVLPSSWTIDQTDEGGLVAVLPGEGTQRGTLGS